MSSLPSAAVDLIEIGENTLFQVVLYGKWKWLHYDQVLARQSLLPYMCSSSKARKS